MYMYVAQSVEGKKALGRKALKSLSPALKLVLCLLSVCTVYVFSVSVHVHVHACNLFSDFSSTAFTPELIGCKKVIVSVPQLMQLLPVQCIRATCSQPVTVKEQYRGCGLLFHFSCGAGHSYTWSSSGEHLNADGIAVHANNLLLAASCLLSGNSFSKIERMFNFMGLQCISEQMYYRHVTMKKC